MEFRILGPLEVRDDGRAIALGASKQRVLLAVLLLASNRPVSVDRLIDAIWPTTRRPERPTRSSTTSRGSASYSATQN